VPLAGVETVSVTANSGRLRSSVTVQSWPSSTDFPTAWPVALWQTVQFSSLSWAPPVWLVPVTKSTSLWHEPQASRDGVVFHASTSAPAPSWHFWQLARTDGKADFHHSSLLFWKPQIA
jgi:hypothetical protein